MLLITIGRLFIISFLFLGFLESDVLAERLAVFL